MNSLEIREFSNAITQFCNNSKLPMEVKRLALRDILRDIEKSTDAELIQQISDRDEQEMEGGVGNGTEQTIQQD